MAKHQLSTVSIKAEMKKAFCSPVAVKEGDVFSAITAVTQMLTNGLKVMRDKQHPAVRDQEKAVKYLISVDRELNKQQTVIEHHKKRESYLMGAMYELQNESAYYKELFEETKRKHDALEAEKANGWNV